MIKTGRVWGGDLQSCCVGHLEPNGDMNNTCGELRGLDEGRGLPVWII